MLLSIDINPNFQGEYGDTALIKASQYGHSEIVRLLLKNKADVNLQDRCECTVLMDASEREHLDTVRLLLKNKADFEDYVIRKFSPEPFIILIPLGLTQI